MYKSLKAETLIRLCLRIEQDIPVGSRVIMKMMRKEGPDLQMWIEDGQKRK